MNADHRATPPSTGPFNREQPTAGQGAPTPPRTGTAQPQSSQAPTYSSGAAPRPSGQAPQGSGQPPQSSGQVPQRTSIRSGQFPTNTPAGASSAGQGNAPVSGAQQPRPPFSTESARPFGSVGAPGAAPAQAPASRPAPQSSQQPTAGDAEQGGVKGLAAKAKAKITGGDDDDLPERKGGPRKVRVLVSRIDPWSALKIGFLLSIAAGIMLTVAVYVVWNVLNQMGLFALANEWVSKLFTEDQEINLLQFFDQNRVMSATVLISVVNVILLTALSTIVAFLYNTVSAIVGGIYVTLTDD